MAARFGIGRDFWINIVLTICGYIPGKPSSERLRTSLTSLKATAITSTYRYSACFHPSSDHAYTRSQNIRNNKNHARTPKWVQKYGLVDLSEIKRKERKSQWANRYKDRLPRSAYEGQPLEEGQVDGGSSVDLNQQRDGNGQLWKRDEEQYYNADNNSNNSGGSRWHYPANFDDAVMDSAMLKQSKKKSRKHDKKNRWERTQDAYSLPPEGEHTGRKRKSKKKSKQRSTDSIASSQDSGPEFPEDPEGRLYGSSSYAAPPVGQGQAKDKTTDDVFKHEF